VTGSKHGGRRLYLSNVLQGSKLKNPNMLSVPLVQGYELDPDEFVLPEALEDCTALDRWEISQRKSRATSRQLDLIP